MSVYTRYRTYFIQVVFLFVALAAYPVNKLVTYPAPEGAELMNDFCIKVRAEGQEWKEIPGYLVKVDEVNGVGHHVSEATMSYFDFDGTVEVSVVYNKGKINTARVRPLSYGIEPKIHGNTLTFTLDRPRNLSVEVNGDIFHNLHLFANPLETFVPDKNDPDLIYFGPGIHTIENERFSVPSGKTVYVAGGAVIKGQIVFDHVKNAKLFGRGMIDQSVRLGVSIENSENIEVEGVFCSQCLTGGSDQVVIRNVKTISYFQWGDGMNVMASNNVLFDGVFNRNSDDCTTVYGTRKGFLGGCRNVTMQNSTLWADVAHPIFIGLHGNADSTEILENLNYINIDILDHKEAQIDYQGCLGINAGDNNLIRNVLFENIRIEDFRQGQLVNLRIAFNKKYCMSPGRGIENIRFKDITYNGKNAELSIISGYDDSRWVKGIVFENLMINGKLITDNMKDKPGWYKTSDMARFFVGEHVGNISFVKTDDEVATAKPVEGETVVTER